jgi:hypothetical protein
MEWQGTPGATADVPPDVPAAFTMALDGRYFRLWQAAP